MRRRRRVALALAALASLAALGWAVSELTSGDGGGDYASFERCPLGDPRTDLCLYTQTAGGEFVVGEKTVPLSRAITLQGGVHVVQNREREIVEDQFIAAAGGETVSRTPQPVPGGLPAVVDPGLLPPALRKSYDQLVAGGATEVTATIELAAPPSSIAIDVQNLIEGEGTALVLPVKVRLSGALLGAGCRLGSSRRPVSLRLSTGRTDPPAPNRPIEGKTGKAKLKDDYNLTVLKGSSLVNNSFAAPGAEGCGRAREGLLDRAVDGALHLPAPAGHNTAILDGTLQEANASAVKSH